MPVELTIVESVTELETTVTEVILESASAPGPAGPGVPAGGTANQVLTKDSGTDYDTSWQDAQGAGGGAPTDVDYLVGTASGDLSAEIVVGTSPGGELGGTWASPTVDATHSGSSHASVQAAAEATAAAALASHEGDTTSVHGIADTSALALTANAVMDGDAAGGVLGGTYPNPSFAADMATQAELDAHVNDTSAAHAASAISADSTTLVGTGTDVQAVLEELDNGIADHLADTSAAHAASAISFTPTGSVAATDVQAAIAEVASEAGGISSTLFDANSILKADSDDTPVALTMGASTILARLAAGSIKAASTSEIRTLLDVPTNAEAILDALIDAKGDLLVGTASDTVARKAVGATNGMMLSAQSGQSDGLLWALPPGFELNYKELTSDQTISATSAAAAATVLAADSVTFDGSTRVCIEFYAPVIQSGSSNGSVLLITLWEDSTDLGVIATASSSGNSAQAPCHTRRFLTPTSGAKVYTVKAYRSVSNGIVRAASPYITAYVRITVA